MRFQIATKFIAACAMSAGATASFSHVVLQDGAAAAAAAAGASYRAPFRVGHGCDGSTSTGGHSH